MVELSASTIRRQQQKLALRQAILDAARQIARDEGWQAVTMRRVAERIGYSHPTLYEFFEDKQALLAAIHRMGFAQLRDALRAARLSAGSADLYPRAMSLAYCEFAWQHPELYQAMHSLGGVQINMLLITPEGESVVAEARSAVDAWAAGAGVTVRNATDAVLIMWATLHGIASLALSEHMPGGRKQAAALAVQAVEGLHAGWKARDYV